MAKFTVKADLSNLKEVYEDVQKYNELKKLADADPDLVAFEADANTEATAQQ